MENLKQQRKRYVRVEVKGAASGFRSTATFPYFHKKYNCGLMDKCSYNSCSSSGAASTPPAPTANENDFPLKMSVRVTNADVNVMVKLAADACIDALVCATLRAVGVGDESDIRAFCAANRVQVQLFDAEFGKHFTILNYGERVKHLGEYLLTFHERSAENGGDKMGGVAKRAILADVSDCLVATKINDWVLNDSVTTSSSEARCSLLREEIGVIDVFHNSKKSDEKSSQVIDLTKKSLQFYDKSLDPSGAHRISRLAFDEIRCGDFYSTVTESHQPAAYHMPSKWLCRKSVDSRVAKNIVLCGNHCRFEAMPDEQRVSFYLGMIPLRGHNKFFKGIWSPWETFFCQYYLKYETVHVDLSNRDALKWIFDHPLNDNNYIVESVTYGIVMHSAITYVGSAYPISEIGKAVNDLIFEDDISQRFQNIIDNVKDKLRIEVFANEAMAEHVDASPNFSEWFQQLRGLKDKFAPQEFCAIDFHLVPIVDLVKPECLSSPINSRLDVRMTNLPFTSILSNISDCKKQLAELFVDDYADCFTADELRRLQEHRSAVESYDTVLDELHRLVLKIRQNGELDLQQKDFYRLMALRDDSARLVDEIRSMDSVVQKVHARVARKRFLFTEGVMYVTGKYVDALLKFDQTEAVYVFFYLEDDVSDFAMHTFKRLINAGENCVFVEMELVKSQDLDLNIAQEESGEEPVETGSVQSNGEEPVETGSVQSNREVVPFDETLAAEGARSRFALAKCIAKFRGTRCVKRDCVQDEMKWSERGNVVKLRRIDRCTTRPSNVVQIEIPCPLLDRGHECADGECREVDTCWECDDCQHFLCVNRDDFQLIAPQPNDDMNRVLYFYCECGRAMIDDATFRCNCTQHSLDFSRSTTAYISMMLRDRFTAGDRVILVLGKTGVGKSTWINAFANYLSFTTLDEAMAAEKPICVIPSQFTLTEDNGNGELVKRDIIMGEPDENESTKAATSKTRSSKVYIFPHHGKRVLLIDTPGVGDTDGPVQDVKNFRNILAQISLYQKIHGICILLKPNDSRLDVVFKYCIGELLTHLHKEAAKNIVFCFTNARATLYRPGDTITPLQQYLEEEIRQKQGISIEVKKNTAYCLDNEAFRFLWAYRQGIKFTDAEYRDFAESWRRSYAETSRFLKYISGIEPHNTESTINFNEARRIILTLAKPLAMISQNIQANIYAIEQQTNEVRNLDTSSADLNQRLKVPRVILKQVPLPYPRTVCGVAECTEYRKDGDSKDIKLYRSLCHAHCYLPGVQLNTYPNEALKLCAAMRPTYETCNVCHHNWSTHLHISYDQTEQTIYEEDEVIREALSRNKNRAICIESAIKAYEKKIIEYKEEQRFITEVGALFGTFLKHNSIITYNDAIKAYVELSITEARKHAEFTGNFDRVNALEQCLREYIEHKTILERCIQDGSGQCISPEEVKRYYFELMALKLCGEDIRQFFEQEEKAQKEQVKHAEKVFEPKRAPKRIGFNAGKDKDKRKELDWQQKQLLQKKSSAREGCFRSCASRNDSSGKFSYSGAVKRRQ